MVEKSKKIVTKKCFFCAESILDEAIKCRYCGERLDNTISPRVIKIGKFIILSFVTFGFYQYIWFYKQWSFLKKEFNLNVSPFVHTFLAPFYMGSIVNYTKILLKAEQTTCLCSAIITGILYFIVSCIGWHNFYFFWFFSTLLLIIPVGGMNKYYQKKEKRKLDNIKTSWWQWLIIAFIIIFLLPIFFGF